jgi:hypothetical protein
MAYGILTASGAVGREFESLRAHHFLRSLFNPSCFDRHDSIRDGKVGREQHHFPTVQEFPL